RGLPGSGGTGLKVVLLLRILLAADDGIGDAGEQRIDALQIADDIKVVGARLQAARIAEAQSFEVALRALADHPLVAALAMEQLPCLLRAPVHGGGGGEACRIEEVGVELLDF